MVEYCYSSTQLYGVNPHAPLEGDPSLQLSLGSALCVSKKNNAYQGNYLATTLPQDSSVFSESRAQKAFSFLPQSAGPASSRDTHWDQNDTIPVFYNESGRLLSSGQGVLQLPQADFAGLCNDNNPVQFENNVVDSRCLRRVAAEDFAEQCEAATRITGLLLARSASTAPGSALAGDLLAVRLQQVQYEDYGSGLLRNITSSWLAGGCVASTVSAASLSATSSCGQPSPRSLSLFSSLGGQGLVCRGWLKAVTYTVRHSTAQPGTIEAVLAAITVTDLPVLPAAAGRQLERQSFSVQFVSSSNSQVSAANGNLDTRQRSGNPGYVVGKPVLFGHASTANKVVYPASGGLQVPSPLSPFNAANPQGFGSGACPLTFNDTTGLTQVLFGRDMAAGCTARLSISELEAVCCQGSQYCSPGTRQFSQLSDDSGVPFFLAFSPGVVGIYGSADPLDSSQWLPLEYTAPLDLARRWDPLTSTCYNMYTGLNIRLLVASTGEAIYPQNKIVAALAELVVEDWTFSLPPLTTAKQAFPLAVAVSFISLPLSSDTAYSPPPPPVLFKVPYDVFYPFTVNEASPSRMPCGYATYTSMALLLLWLLS